MLDVGTHDLPAPESCSSLRREFRFLIADQLDVNRIPRSLDLRFRDASKDSQLFVHPVHLHLTPILNLPIVRLGHNSQTLPRLQYFERLYLLLFQLHPPLRLLSLLLSLLAVRGDRTDSTLQTSFQRRLESIYADLRPPSMLPASTSATRR